MRAVVSVALVALAGAVGPAAAVRAQVQAPVAAPAARKIPGLSDEGNALYAKTFGTPDPQLLGIARQQRQVQNSLVSLAMGATVDVDRLAGLLKQRDALQLQFRTRQNELTVAMLHQLSDEDRGIYLRFSMTPPTPPRAR